MNPVLRCDTGAGWSLTGGSLNSDSTTNSTPCVLDCPRQPAAAGRCADQLVGSALAAPPDCGVGDLAHQVLLSTKTVDTSRPKTAPLVDAARSPGTVPARPHHNDHHRDHTPTALRERRCEPSHIVVTK